jgi:hypothetical protein
VPLCGVWLPLPCWSSIGRNQCLPATSVSDFLFPGRLGGISHRQRLIENTSNRLRSPEPGLLLLRYPGIEPGFKIGIKA